METHKQKIYSMLIRVRMKKTFIPITNTEILITRLLAAKLITSKKQQQKNLYLDQ